MSNITILIADDENRIRKLVADFLKKESYSVIEAENGKQALEIFLSSGNKIDLVILDILMPKMDGFEVLKQIRKNSKVPILMLTAKGEEADQLNGFKLGADDYVHKPFSPVVLVARIQSMLKRSGILKGEIIQMGEIVLDDIAHAAYIGKQQLELTPKEYDLLQYFFENKGIALTRERILNTVWNFDYYGDLRTVDTHIKQLRSKLGDKGAYIQTVRGVGYKFDILA